MRHIEVLGFDCPACNKTFRRIDETARELGLDIRLEKVAEPARLLGYQVLRPPAVAIDGRLVHSGGVPSHRQIEAWLQPAQGDSHAG
ncbi:thioredoxin family protein [Sulfuritortus calidifontis]|nr:thioredoxin family protein [Sulfuritortus calidifontis]